MITEKNRSVQNCTAPFGILSLYNIVVSSNESTVVAEYVAEYDCSNSYQSEANLEQDFIKRLQEQGYEHIGDKEAGSIVLLKNYEAYYNGFDENGKHQPGYAELIGMLSKLMVNYLYKAQHRFNAKKTTHNDSYRYELFMVLHRPATTYSPGQLPAKYHQR